MIERVSDCVCVCAPVSVRGSDGVVVVCGPAMGDTKVSAGRHKSVASSMGVALHGGCIVLPLSSSVSHLNIERIRSCVVCF
jgi:hypothetical protein